jgi:hypothetical protein
MPIPVCQLTIPVRAVRQASLGNAAVDWSAQVFHGEKLALHMNEVSPCPPLIALTRHSVEPLWRLVEPLKNSLDWTKLHGGGESYRFSSWLYRIGS